MLQLSYTEQKGLKNRINPFDDSSKAKFTLPQQANLFYGGRIYDKLGALVQLTYDGVANDFFLDNTDIRYANNLILGGKNFTWGVTLNNNPTVQDVWNSTPAFGHPYAASAVAVTPAAATIIDGTLARQVGGMGVYAIWNAMVYGEITAYRTNNKGISRPLGAGTTVGMVVDDLAPYWRAALQYQWEKNALTVGAYGMIAKVFAGSTDSGPSDTFTDVAFDTQYQFTGIKNLFSTAATWIHEKQDWDAGYRLGNTTNPSDDLNTLRINGNYYYRSSWGTVGGTVAYFST